MCAGPSFLSGWTWFEHLDRWLHPAIKSGGTLGIAHVGSVRLSTEHHICNLHVTAALPILADEPLSSVTRLPRLDLEARVPPRLMTGPCVRWYIWLSYICLHMHSMCSHLLLSYYTCVPRSIVIYNCILCLGMSICQ